MTFSNAPEVRPAGKLTATIGVILLAAVAAGSMDLVYAASFAREGTTMPGVMRAIASGVLGAEAFKGGAPAAQLGALLHYGILSVAGAIFVAAGRFRPAMFQRPLISGAAFGLGIFVVMKIVVSLSRAPFGVSTDIEQIVRNLLVHIFLVGMPMALIIASGLSRPDRAAADSASA